MKFDLNKIALTFSDVSSFEGTEGIGSSLGRGARHLQLDVDRY